MSKYLVATGISYGNEHADPGDVVDNLPEDATEALISAGIISRVIEDYMKG